MRSKNAPAVSLLRVESPVGDAGARTQPKCGEAAVALAQDLPVRLPARAALHARPRPKCRERDNASARPYLSRRPTEVLMSTTKQCLACIRTCHRIAREGEGYVATSMRYGLDLTALQMELVTSAGRGSRATSLCIPSRSPPERELLDSYKLDPAARYRGHRRHDPGAAPVCAAIARGALFGVGADGADGARPPDWRDGRRGGRSQPCPRLDTLASRHRPRRPIESRTYF